MTAKTPSRSDALITAMHEAALRALAAAPGGQLKASALKQAIEATVPLDDWARETYASTGHTRERPCPLCGTTFPLDPDMTDRDLYLRISWLRANPYADDDDG